jgi:ketosteroid isomerase-like protein
MPYYWQVYRVRDGRAVRVEVYSDESDALEAVGLSE